MPNAGKSTLINTLTNADSRVGSYPFTTIEPHLGDFYGFVIADIPGLIEGAAEGKGLGHKFLKHVEKTKMLLHLVSLEDFDPKSQYYTIFNELAKYNKDLINKETWIVLTKKDLISQDILNKVLSDIDTYQKRVFVIAQNAPESIKKPSDALIEHLRSR